MITKQSQYTGCPFWSVMIPTYNPDLSYLEQAVHGVLSQQETVGEMQIEVVDDCSPEWDADQLWNIFRDSKICVYRQPRRLGMTANWNSCIDRARGSWIHILHQDDQVLPGFYQAYARLITDKPGVGAVFCRSKTIDAEGHTLFTTPVENSVEGIFIDWLEHIFVGLRIRASSMVVKHTVYSELRNFSTEFQYAHDWDMWKRIAAKFPIGYVPDVLHCYRRHDLSATNGYLASGRNLREIARSIDVSKSYLPTDVAADVERRSRAYYCRYGADLAWEGLLRRDFRVVWAQLREARKLGSLHIIAKHLLDRFSRSCVRKGGRDASGHHTARARP